MTARAWQIWLIAFAFLAKAAIPVGYMLAPADGRDNLPEIVICTGSGAKQLALHESDGKGGGERDQSQSPCPFATAALFMLATAPTFALRYETAARWDTLPPTFWIVPEIPRAWHARAPPAAIAT